MTGSIFSKEAPDLLEDHFRHLHEGSGISMEVILERGYRSLLGRSELKKLGFSTAQQRVPGILIPLWGVNGKLVGHQYRPDNPRLDQRGRSVKYESPRGATNHLDCPRRSQGKLGDPAFPLWVTEGSKKSDALASRGACAISVTGVWGFKGKNALGGTTFLADWDYIALNGRTVYLAFDSDIITKEPVKKALSRLIEHLSRRGAKVLVVHLPQEGSGKVGIDDYLLKHSLEEAEKLAEEAGSTEAKTIEHAVLGFMLSDGTVGEMIVSENDERAFIVASSGSVRRMERYEAGKVAYVPSGDPLVGQVVHFAATAAPYDSQVTLFSEAKAFIHRYVELPADFEDIAALYVLLTWVYEFAPSIPYLRVIGDWGSGKTRFLDVVGRICFRPIFASGATTPSPVFRILDKFRGTLILDEADFKDSSAWVEMVKILNNGYRPGFPVLRADKEDGRWYPHGYQVFGPKLIATRSTFKDEALESRCLTAEMMPLTRTDIPRVLPPSFHSEVKELRSKLLTFRLANLLKLKGKTFGNELIEPNLQPRLQEILIPLKAMVNGDLAMAESLSAFIYRLQESLFVRRRESPAGRVLAALIELHEEGVELSAKNIADKVSEMDDDAPTLTTQKVGWLTKKLGLEKDKDSSSRRHVIRWDAERIARQAAIYGLNDMFPISQQNYFESFETFAPDTDSRVKEFPKEFQAGQNSFASSEAETKEPKESKEFSEDRAEARVLPVLSMTLKQAVAIWEAKGRPVIPLGPGESCFDLACLLDRKEINERHLAAVRQWLADNGPPATSGSSAHEAERLTDWDALERDIDTFLREAEDDG